MSLERTPKQKDSEIPPCLLFSYVYLIIKKKKNRSETHIAFNALPGVTTLYPASKYLSARRPRHIPVCRGQEVEAPEETWQCAHSWLVAKLRGFASGWA